MEENLDQNRVSQIRRELENYSTEQLTEIWRRHNLEEWTAEAFAAIRQILAARPAAQVSAPLDIGQAGDHLESARQSGEAGRWQEALREIDLAIQNDPDSLEAHQYRGHILEDSGDLDGAILAYRKARYLDRRNESTRLDLRRVMTKQFQLVSLKRQSTEDAEYRDEEEAEETGEANSVDQDAAGEETEEVRIDDGTIITAQSEPAQPLSISTLILIGLATAWVSIAFIVFSLMIYSQLQNVLSGASGSLLQFASQSDIIILFFSGLLWLGLLVFYMHHLVNNDNILASRFGLIGASLIFLPFVSMPIYFYIYVWQTNLDNPG